MEALIQVEPSKSFFDPIDDARARQLDEIAKWPQGLYRRTITLKATANSCAAQMQDNFHHFALSLHHDGVHISGLSADAIRVPWTACSGAVDMLAGLHGQPLSELAERVKSAERRQHCNHLFDLALLCCDHALRAASGGDTFRQYDIDIALDSSSQSHVRCKRNGAVVAYLTLEYNEDWDSRVASAGPLFNSSLGSLKDLPLGALTSDDREIIYVLRRAAHVSLGKWMEEPKEVTALEYGVPPTCYAFQPERAATAHRILSSIHDFTNRPMTMR